MGLNSNRLFSQNEKSAILMSSKLLILDTLDTISGLVSFINYINICNANKTSNTLMAIVPIMQ